MIVRLVTVTANGSASLTQSECVCVCVCTFENSFSLTRMPLPFVNTVGEEWSSLAVGLSSINRWSVLPQGVRITQHTLSLASCDLCALALAHSLNQDVCIPHTCSVAPSCHPFLVVCVFRCCKSLRTAFVLPVSRGDVLFTCQSCGRWGCLSCLSLLLCCPWLDRWLTRLKSRIGCPSTRIGASQVCCLMRMEPYVCCCCAMCARNTSPCVTLCRRLPLRSVSSLCSCSICRLWHQPQACQGTRSQQKETVSSSLCTRSYTWYAVCAVIIVICPLFVHVIHPTSDAHGLVL